MGVLTHRLHVAIWQTCARKACGAAFHVSVDDVASQYQQVAEHFGLVIEESKLMTRCSKCNSKARGR
mgnify:CR=1 FL=1